MYIPENPSTQKSTKTPKCSISVAREKLHNSVRKRKPPERLHL